MYIKNILPPITASAGLAACGDTIGKQALGGGAVGAGAAAITGGSLAQRAAIGAGAHVLACQSGAVRCK